MKELNDGEKVCLWLAVIVLATFIWIGMYIKSEGESSRSNIMTRTAMPTSTRVYHTNEELEEMYSGYGDFEEEDVYDEGYDQRYVEP